jgi:hypothetical protein
MKIFTKNYFAFFIMMLLSASLVLTTSCDKDDDEDEIVGTWELEKAEATMGDITETMTAAEMGMELTVVFKDDGTMSATSVGEDGTETDSGTWTRVDDNTVDIMVDGDTETLKKEGSYYVLESVDEEYDMTMKMYFKKV